MHNAQLLLSKIECIPVGEGFPLPKNIRKTCGQGNPAPTNLPTVMYNCKLYIVNC